MHPIHRVLVVGALALASSAPAFAQAFNAELDCGGLFAAGDSVPYKVRLEEQALVSHSIDLTVEIAPPGMPVKTVFHKVFTLLPNQDLNIKKSVLLKANAPAGEYVMDVIADDGSLVMSDTCSFQVQ